MKRGKSVSLFIGAVVIIALLAYIGYFGAEAFGYRFKSFGQSINKGLDLQGGSSILMEIKADEVDKDTINRTIELISMRVNKLGVSETSVTREGDKRIRIEIPGQFDTKSVLDTVGKTGELKFTDSEKNIILSGQDVKNAVAQYDNEGKAVVGLEFNDEGTKKFADATTKNVGKQIAISMDDEVLTNPQVNQAITDGKAVITGMESLEDATRIANIIKSGALPVPVQTLSVKTVGPTIGMEAVGLSKKAAVVGIAFVMIFMSLYYKRPGVICSLAIVLYVCLLLYAFAIFEVTLTLSGIAGFLLTVGMAVDANVLIFERIREELRTGKSVKSSVESGFSKALATILDSNITTIIAAVSLYIIGTGSVKGFGLTLIIGIVISIFTALTVTKFLINMAVNIGILNKPSHFGVKKGVN
ncbi:MULTISPECIES: protein translocase subunit SecD [Clostridium]|uniref:Protein translocase subunit SecD n=1 Tax=Clostridium senegalense TaxID=1465809 RepID=A0A6M0H1V5_9CLOT|nr:MULTISPECIES: protein translocase subunit SecD [Clostridium]NEU03881.1 protein translocase subunit SecD [Clostridium senegalense]